jgi:hypothetical protein
MMIKIAERIFDDIIVELELVILKIHKEEYITTKQQNRSSTTSSFTIELFAKIRWVFREILSKFLIKQTRIDWY